MKTIDYRLILALSLFGLLMAVATVFVIPSRIEPIFWLTIFGACAVVIARRRVDRPFLHGFLVSLANCVWITTAHILLFDSYLARHPDEAAMMKSMPLPDSPRLMMLMTGPLIGVISGLVLGSFAWLATKIVKPAAA